MSLPEAKKEISAHPGKNSVTTPNIKADMQADVDRKMRLYGVIQALRDNRYPDNQQIEETLDYVLENSPVDETKLSRDGRKLIADVRDIIETAKQIVKQKNSDELVQQFLYDTTNHDATAPSLDTKAVDVSKDDVKKDGNQAAEHLRTLLRIVTTNGEARKLLSDISIIGKDLFARGAAKAAETVRPDAETLARVDDAAPDSQFHGPNGEVRGPNEPAPDVVSDETVEKAKVAANKGQEVASKAADDAANTTEGLKSEAQSDKPDDEKADTAKKTLKEKLLGVKDSIPDEHKDTAKKHYNKGVDFLKDEFPEERRDQYIYRLKKVLVECQKHQDYQEALTWFLGAIETYFGHGKALASDHASKAGDSASDPGLQRAASELRTVLERFANGQSFEPILNAANALNEDAKNDEGLREWFKRLDAYIRKALLEPGFVLSPAFDNDAKKLNEDGKAFFDEKYAGHKDNLFNAIQTWFTAFGEDPLNKRFGEDWKRLTKDLLFAADGELTFKPHLWTDLRKVIIPTLVKHVGYIPIPRIEYTDDAFDLVIENLTMEGTNLLPNIVHVEANNAFKFSPYDTIKDEGKHDFKFTFSQIQADMRDVAFYFNKKSGIPKLKDSGLADVLLAGEGLTVKVHLTGAGNDRSSVFKVKDVNAKVDSLKFSVRDTKHDLLYKTIKPLAAGLVKKQIGKAIEDAIKTGLEYIDDQLVAVRDRYESARDDPNTSTTDSLKALFERKADDAASKAESAKKKSGQFQVVSKRDSILVPAGHESGWINKVADRDEAVKVGNGWKSAAFNIVPTASPAAGQTPAP